MTKPTFKFHFPIVFAAVAANPEKLNRLLNRLNDRIIVEVNAAIDAGQIILIDSKTIRENINRFVQQAFDSIVWERYVHAGKWESLPEDLKYLDHVYEARLIPSFLKKLDKVSPEAKKCEMYGVARLLAEELLELAEVVAYLKTIEVKATAVRAAKKAREEERRAIVNATDAVYQAVFPLKKMAQDRAEEMFRADVEQAKATLLKHGNDLDSILPYPEKGDSGTMRAISLARSFYLSICIYDPEMEDGNFLLLNDDKVEKEVGKVRRDAGFEFEAYVAKLNTKINAKADKAVLEGNPWFGSHLTVYIKDREPQVWHTKMIVNRSKLGKLFNQFPTRLVK